MNILQLKNPFSLLLLIFFVFVLLSCSEDNVTTPNLPALDLNISIISDPHLFDSELGLPGSSFDEAKKNSRKMIAESESILISAINTILSTNSELVLIPGDLTKDGEKSSHIKFAQYIQQLSDAGKKVFVVPGNHDILNPDSYRYEGDSKIRTETITPDDFKQIYHNFGYNGALYIDNNSLSYIAEPIDGLWIIAMDACRYNENTDRHVVGGKFNQSTLNWIKGKIKEGKAKGKLMLGMLHHGILEHFKDQKENPIGSEFVIDDFKNISEDFANLGLNFIFTGHFHATDIVKSNTENSFLYDIETGSLLTYPVAMRTINIKQSQTMDISTNYVNDVNLDLKGMSFQNYAKNFLTSDLDSFVANILVNQFQLDSITAIELSPIGVESFIAHYKGDEIISKDASDLIKKYEMSSNFTVQLFLSTVKSLFNDLNPADKTISINMKTGEIIK
jgi:3',5'-cyclic AMP phosphodiesterase CpdA